MAKEDTIEEAGKKRYSDTELEEFRQIILEKLGKAREDLKMLTDAYAHGNENDTSDTSPTPRTPNGCPGFGTSTITVSIIGRSSAVGMR